MVKSERPCDGKRETTTERGKHMHNCMAVFVSLLLLFFLFIYYRPLKKTCFIHFTAFITQIYVILHKMRFVCIILRSCVAAGLWIANEIAERLLIPFPSLFHLITPLNSMEFVQHQVRHADLTLFHAKHLFISHFISPWR